MDYHSQYLYWDGLTLRLWRQLVQDTTTVVGTEMADFGAAMNFMFHDCFYFYNKATGPSRGNSITPAGPLTAVICLTQWPVGVYDSFRAHNTIHDEALTSLSMSDPEQICQSNTGLTHPAPWWPGSAAMVSESGPASSCSTVA